MKKFLAFLLIVFVCLSLASCFPGDGSSSSFRPAGFFSGVWHGWIAPISLVLSFFNRSLSIYESANTGFMYDLGYYMAIISGMGGLALKRRKKDRD